MAVTGAGGYIGTQLVRDLLEQNFEVLAIDRFFFGFEPLNEFKNNKNLNKKNNSSWQQSKLKLFTLNIVVRNETHRFNNKKKIHIKMKLKIIKFESLNMRLKNPLKRELLHFVRTKNQSNNQNLNQIYPTGQNMVITRSNILTNNLIQPIKEKNNENQISIETKQDPTPIDQQQEPTKSMNNSKETKKSGNNIKLPTSKKPVTYFFQTPETATDDYVKGAILRLLKGKKNKDKTKDDFEFNPFQASLMATVGYGDWSLYMTYGLTDIFNEGSAPKVRGVNAGILLSF